MGEARGRIGFAKLAEGWEQFLSSSSKDVVFHSSFPDNEQKIEVVCGVVRLWLCVAESVVLFCGTLSLIMSETGRLTQSHYFSDILRSKLAGLFKGKDHR